MTRSRWAVLVAGFLLTVVLPAWNWPEQWVGGWRRLDGDYLGGAGSIWAFFGLIFIEVRRDQRQVRDDRRQYAEKVSVWVEPIYSYIESAPVLPRLLCSYAGQGLIESVKLSATLTAPRAMHGMVVELHPIGTIGPVRYRSLPLQTESLKKALTKFCSDNRASPREVHFEIDHTFVDGAGVRWFSNGSGLREVGSVR